MRQHTWVLDGWRYGEGIPLNYTWLSPEKRQVEMRTLCNFPQCTGVCRVCTHACVACLCTITALFWENTQDSLKAVDRLELNSLYVYGLAASAFNPLKRCCPTQAETLIKLQLWGNVVGFWVWCFVCWGFILFCFLVCFSIPLCSPPLPLHHSLTLDGRSPLGHSSGSGCCQLSLFSSFPWSLWLSWGGTQWRLTLLSGWQDRRQTAGHRDSHLP